MAIINLKQMKANEPTRDFDSSVDENTNIAAESDQGQFGAFKFFTGIKAFFKGISALGTLASGSRLPVTDSNGNVTYTTMNDVNNYVVNNALTDLAKNFKNTDDMNKAKCDIGKVAFYYVASGSANCPPLPSGIAAGWNVHVMNNSNNAYRLVQIAYSTNSNYPATFTRLTNDGDVWSNWVKLTTETDLNTRKISTTASNLNDSLMTVFNTLENNQFYNGILGYGSGVLVNMIRRTQSDASAWVINQDNSFYTCIYNGTQWTITKVN